MSLVELTYLGGVIIAFLTFAVVLFVVSIYVALAKPAAKTAPVAQRKTTPARRPEIGAHIATGA